MNLYSLLGITFFLRCFCTFEHCWFQTFEDVVVVLKLCLKDFGSHGQNVPVRVYRKKEKAFITLLTESLSFVS